MSYQPKWKASEDQILAVAADVRASYPAAWAKARAPHDDGEYIRRVAYACHRLVSSAIGLNGKRGTMERSRDVLALPNPTGAKDAGGTYPGIEIIDIIGGHESPSASLTWIDQTQVTMDQGTVGRWIKPEAVDSGTPEPVEPAPAQPPHVCPEPPPAPPYPGDAVFDAILGTLEEDAKRAGQTLNPGSGRWVGRVVYDYFHGGLSIEASIAKHRAEWRLVLGLEP